MREFLNAFAKAVQPYLEKFYAWFNLQEGSVKAAVIAVIGTLMTGCFAILAAIITRPSPAPVIVVTATSIPATTSPFLVSPTPIPLPTQENILHPTTTPFPSSALSSIETATPTPTKSANNIFIAPTPILDGFENASRKMSIELTSIILGSIGLIFVILGLWLIWLIFFDRRNYHKNTIFTVIIIPLILFEIWQLIGWGGVIIAIFSGVGIGFIILIVTSLLDIPYFGSSLVGATVGLFIGVGGSLLYLAIPGPFISDYIRIGILIGVTSGAILGLLLSSIRAGTWK